MERHAYIAHIKAGGMDDYIAAHKEIPAAVVNRYKQLGIHQVTMFQHGDMVFMYIEADDMQRAAQVLKDDADDKAWNDFVRPFKQQEFQEMREIFNLE